MGKNSELGGGGKGYRAEWLDWKWDSKGKRTKGQGLLFE